MSADIDLHVQQVDSVGQAIEGLDGQARETGAMFLGVVADAENSVGHPTLSSALGRYHADWSGPTNEFAHAIEELGRSLSGAARAIGMSAEDAGGVATGVSNTASSLAERLNGDRPLA